MSDEEQKQIQVSIGLDKIYVKDISLEIPGAPQVFLQRENPKVDMQLNSQSSQVSEGVFEVVVMGTVTAKVGDKVLFLIEVKQAGIFNVRNIPAENMEPILAVMCPNILYPYLREAISDISSRAGFAPVLLSVVSFESIYQQQKQQNQAATTH